MQEPTNATDLESSPAPVAGPIVLWQAQQVPPICPTCQTYCRCRRTLLREDARVQYRYCASCDYTTKTVLPLR